MPNTILTKDFPAQDQDLVYALDIGTRSVIGMLAKLENGRAHILAIEKQPHEKRAMLDGQIEDIDQVADTVMAITRRLEEKCGVKLSYVCVAAAGRSLKTQRGTGRLELEAPQSIGNEEIQALTAQAVSHAEENLHQTETSEQRMLLVGYTSTQSRLDGYPMGKLLGHTGQILENDVVATFLPSEVVDSLHAVVKKAGLETASLTLEPIAALNAAIPPQLRLLNLVLVDIGAGTSDIAACRDGSVVGYTMATVAGDEISEALMREYLIDYDTAERIKEQLACFETIRFEDVVGFEQTYPAEEILKKLEPTIHTLVKEITQQIVDLNDGPPSAVFLAGGGSKLIGLCDKVADELGMDHKRVALSGGHFKINCYADDFDLEDPEYTTPLGIAISSCLGLISDSSRVFLNGVPAKLFRSGQLTIIELLMMNGYRYEDLIGRSGKNLFLYIDGKRVVYRGTTASPAILLVNGVPAQASRVIYAGDKIEFSPAQKGEDREMTAGELMKLLNVSGLKRRDEMLEPEEPLYSGDRITTVDIVEMNAPVESGDSMKEIVPEKEDVPEKAVIPEKAEEKMISIRLNGKERRFPVKRDGTPLYLMDLLEYSGLDFDHLEHPVTLKVNGKNGLFQQVIVSGDDVTIQ